MLDPEPAQVGRNRARAPTPHGECLTQGRLVVSTSSISPSPYRPARIAHGGSAVSRGSQISTTATEWRARNAASAWGPVVLVAQVGNQERRARVRDDLAQMDERIGKA